VHPFNKAFDNRVIITYYDPAFQKSRKWQNLWLVYEKRTFWSYLKRGQKRAKRVLVMSEKSEKRAKGI
jgi:hypothetical protein